MVSTKDPGGSALERLREFGLRYPGAHTKSPWPGHLDLAVNDKTFAYLSIAGEPFKVSCKLPRSADAALELPFTTPTAYGLGKSGWVTAEFPDGAGVPVELLEEWIDESYRAQAPKRLSAGLPPFGASAAIESDGSRRVASSGRVTKRSSVRRTSPAESSRGARSASKRAVVAAKESAGSAKATAGSRGAVKAAKRAPPAAAARAGRATKRAGGSQRATKRPAKKRARSPA